MEGCIVEIHQNRTVETRFKGSSNPNVPQHCPQLGSIGILQHSSGRAQHGVGLAWETRRIYHHLPATRCLMNILRLVVGETWILIPNIAQHNYIIFCFGTIPITAWFSKALGTNSLVTSLRNLCRGFNPTYPYPTHSLCKPLLALWKVLAEQVELVWV